jgi:3-oxoacyl-[acyl-carrier protein] reductase
MIDLDGKTVLVTGASRGIGRAIARAVGAAGGHVIAHYGRSREAANAVREEIGLTRCDLIRADLAEPDEVAGLWEGACALAGPIDVLINNAGVFERVPVEAALDEWRTVWNRVMQINLLAPAELCRAAIVDFRTRGEGKIINISSRAAHRGDAPDQMPYAASKGALVALTKTIARGYGPAGLLAFGIAPGFTDTEMATESLDAEGLARTVAEIPLGALASAGEIGALAAFLCSDAARHLTGSTFDINGASYVR